MAIQCCMVQCCPPASVRDVDTAQHGDDDFRTLHCLVGSRHVQWGLPVLVPSVDIGRMLNQYLHCFLQQQHRYIHNQAVRINTWPTFLTARSYYLRILLMHIRHGQEEENRTTFIKITSQAREMVLLIQMLDYTSPLLSFRAVSSQSKFPNVILGCTKLPMQRAQPAQLINPPYPSHHPFIEEMNVLI